MNRRSFILGLLSTTAAPAIARAMPFVPFPEPSQEMSTLVNFLVKQNAELVKIMSQQMAQTIIYGNPEWSPIRFTGVYMNVPCFETDEIIDD